MKAGLASWLARALRLLPAETAHGLALAALSKELVPSFSTTDLPRLSTNVTGIDFPNPIGLAAGLDKDAQAMDGLLGLGFGFIEIGSVTPKPQPGNPKPRIFRLGADRAIINRLGFPSVGVATVASRIASWRSSARARPGILGVNLGKSKDSQDAAADYALGAARFSRLADYLVVNVSSPNTPGLRDLQSAHALREIIARVREAAGAPPSGGISAEGESPPLFLKVAPDLDDRMLVEIAEFAHGGHIDAVIVSNTTLDRPDTLRSRAAKQAGGLSGPPLFDRSTQMLRRFYILTHGRVPLIGVGGVSSGADAYQKIRSGASLVQIYTAMIYNGPDFVSRVVAELDDLLESDGFANVRDAVGVDTGLT